jgi:hypothetical protein
MFKQKENRKCKKNTQEKFRRRKTSLISKADDLHRLFGAQVFLAIQYNGKYHTYVSTANSYWPPTREQIVSLLLINL